VAEPPDPPLFKEGRWLSRGRGGGKAEKLPVIKNPQSIIVPLCNIS